MVGEDRSPPATWLVKFEKGMKSKISNDTCFHTKEKSFVRSIRNDRVIGCLAVMGVMCPLIMKA